MSYLLIHGDARRLPIDPKSIDAVVTDPPYGKRFHDGGISAKPTAKWAKPKNAKFVGEIITGDRFADVRSCSEIARVLKDGGSVYLFSQWMIENSWIAGLENAGLTVRNRLIWVKPFQGAGDLQTTYGPRHESIIYATKGRCELLGRRESDLWIEPVGPDGCFKKAKIHPNQKPIALLRWLITKSCRPSSLILDPYLGSGSTAIAALQEGHRFIGIDIEHKYVAIAKRRIERPHAHIPRPGKPESYPLFGDSA